MSLIIALCLLLIFPAPVAADSFRCGSKLVTNGDSVARLLRVCGKPVLKYRGKDRVKGSGKKRSVQQWIYERGRKSAMVVSVLDGRIVAIKRE